MSTTTPPLLKVLRDLIAEQVVEARVGMPGVVVSYDPASMRASVQPAVRKGYLQAGERMVEPLPVINEVPVLWPAWGGGVRIKGTLLPGDPVWLHFSDVSLDRWKALGADVDPEDDRAHHLTDAVCYPGGMSSASDALVQIEITPTEIRLGGSLFGVIHSGRDTAEQSFLAALSTLVAAMVDAAGPTGAQRTAVTGAITALQAAATAAISNTVKVV